MISELDNAEGVNEGLKTKINESKYEKCRQLMSRDETGMRQKKKCETKRDVSLVRFLGVSKYLEKEKKHRYSFNV